MSPRVFVFLLGVTVGAIWIGDIVADGFAAPGLQRTFTVFVIAAAIVAPVAWLMERLGYIRKESVELGRERPPPSPSQKEHDGERNGGAA